MRDFIPGKTTQSGIKKSFGVIPKMRRIGNFETQPYDVIVTYLDILKKMGLEDDNNFLRQVSTVQERNNDEERNIYVAPFSRTKTWTRPMSNTFFDRTRFRMSQRLPKKYHLINVRTCTRTFHTNALPIQYPSHTYPIPCMLGPQ